MARNPGCAAAVARGTKLLTGIAVEIRGPKALGRCGMAPLADASATSLYAFVTDHVEPGATVITDAWPGYRGLDQLGYLHHRRRSQRPAQARAEDPGQPLPAVHRVAWLLKQWLLGTHQRSVDAAHLPLYIDEFVFHFNHRRSRGGWCPTACSSSPSLTGRSATGTSSPASRPERATRATAASRESTEPAASPSEPTIANRWPGIRNSPPK